jgi:hypothetical protein
MKTKTAEVSKTSAVFASYGLRQRRQRRRLVAVVGDRGGSGAFLPPELLHVQFEVPEADCSSAIYRTSDSDESPHYKL